MRCYITSVSFEERCLALAGDLPEAAKGDQVLLLDFMGYENVAPYLFNKAEMKQLLVGRGYRVTPLSVRVNGPIEAQRMLAAEVDRSAPSELTVDISTLPRNYVFTVSNLMLKLGIPTKIRYYRPADYGNELSRGVKSVGAIPGFEGEHQPYGDVVLAIILGFEGYKATYAWEAVGPTRVISFVGDPPYEAEFLSTSTEQNRELLSLVEEGDQHALHTSDPFRAKEQLSEVLGQLTDQASNASIVLCPLGTKPQSLGAFAFAYERPSVAVAYVSSLMYFTRGYSRGFRPEYSEFSLSELIANPANESKNP